MSVSNITDSLAIDSFRTNRTMPVRIRPVQLCLSLVICLGAGCDSDEPAAVPPPTRTAHSADADADAHAPDPQPTDTARLVTGERREFDGLSFVVPADWTEIPLSGFQRGIITAILGMPEAGAEVTLSLSRASGGVDSNFERWRGQFVSSREEITDTMNIAGRDAKLIDLQGKFNPGFGKKADGEWRMLGVIVPLPGQSYFLKLTGPVDQISRVEDQFRDFLQSAAVE